MSSADLINVTGSVIKYFFCAFLSVDFVNTWIITEFSVRNNVHNTYKAKWVTSHINFSIVHSSNHGRHSPKVIY